MIKLFLSKVLNSFNKIIENIIFKIICYNTFFLFLFVTSLHFLKREPRQQLFDCNRGCRFRNYLICSTFDSHFGMRLFWVARNAGNDGLIQLLLVYVLSYSICSFVPIHDGHITVHENQFVLAKQILILLYICPHGF